MAGHKKWPMLKSLKGARVAKRGRLSSPDDVRAISEIREDIPAKHH
jgi:hypothetical protein